MMVGDPAHDRPGDDERGPADADAAVDPDPIDAPNTISAAASPPRTAVASMSAKARSRLGTNLRSTGTS